MKKSIRPSEALKRDAPADARRGLPSRGRHVPQGLSILYEDRDILVVDKSAGLLTIATEKERERTAYSRLMDYVRKGNAKSHQRVFIVHRLDREVSGALVFAKSHAAKMALQLQWERVDKRYLAVVHGRLTTKEGVISSYLMENSSHVVHSVSDQRRGKLSHTAYRVLQETESFSLLEVTLITGRKNQIRVHLSERGHPIVGDAKYGDKARDGVRKRIALHAFSLAFDHPFDGRRVAFKTRIPGYFVQLVGPIHYDDFWESEGEVLE